MVEVLGVVVGNTAREDLAFPRVCRRFEALQLTQSFEQAALAEQLSAWGDVLPAKQPVHELRRSYRFDLLSESTQGEAMDAGQEAALAPFHFVAGGIGEFSAEDDTAGLETKQRSVYVGCWDAQDASQLRYGNRSAMRRPAGDHRELCVFAGG